MVSHVVIGWSAKKGWKGWRSKDLKKALPEVGVGVALEGEGGVIPEANFIDRRR